MSGNAVLLLLAAPILLFFFIDLEKKGRPEVTVLFILGLLVVETLIYPSQNDVPAGLFNASFAGRSIRVPEYIIPIALTARILARGMPRRMGPTAMAWTAFMAWYGFGIIVGGLLNNSFSEIFFQSKALIYIGGGIALVAGVPAKRLANPIAWRNLLIGLGALVALISPMAVAKNPMRIDLPRMPGAVIGIISPDAATILVVIAIIALLFEAARHKRLLIAGIAAVPLLLSPFIATQRAAILGLSVTLGAVAIGSFGPQWRRRMRSTPTEALLLVCILMLPVLVTVSMRALWPPSPGSSIVPFADVLTETFVAERKAQSADTRINLWREGIDQSSDYPWTGWGLGKTYEVERAGQPSESLVGGGFHNIVIDVLVRRGFIGVLIFVIAVFLTCRDSLLAWRRHTNRYAAVFSFACGTAFLGLLGKGMAESLFEKFRLATLFGLLIGAIISLANSARETMEDGGRAYEYECEREDELLSQ